MVTDLSQRAITMAIIASRKESPTFEVMFCDFETNRGLQERPKGDDGWHAVAELPRIDLP